jgi:subtilisin family serine protease
MKSIAPSLQNALVEAVYKGRKSTISSSAITANCQRLCGHRPPLQGLVKFLVALALFTSLAIPSALAEIAIVEGEVLVKYLPDSQVEERKAIESQWSLELVKHHSSIDVYHYRFSGFDTWLVLDSIKKNASVFFAEPNYLRKRQSMPNDPFYEFQWYLPQIGWDTARGEFTGRAPVTVAVIDSGVSKAHSHLLGYLLQQGEWDFADGDADANDESGHGTMVAGIIAGNTDDGVGVAGICENVRILPIRVFDNAGFIAEGSAVDASVLIDALGQARAAGAKVMNLSLGGSAFSYFEFLAVEQCRAAGILLVCAAGNGGLDGFGDNNDISPTYPASYSSDCILSVAATDESDALTSFSNFGASSVDIAAPGQFIVGCDVPRLTLVEWNFNSGWQGWRSIPLRGYGWVWDNFTGEWGLSTRGPYSLYFAGYYASNSEMFLTSPLFDLRGQSGARAEFDVSGSLGVDDFISLSFLDFSGDSKFQGILCYPGWNYGSLNWDISAFDGTFGQLDLFFKADLFGLGMFSSGIFTFENIRITVLDQSSWASDSIWYSQGTSFSAPIVSGVAATLFSQSPNLTAAQVKNLILTTARPVAGLNGKLLKPAVVDYGSALRAAKALSSSPEPTPPLQFLSEALGTWKGSQTVYFGGTKLTANLTFTTQRHGSSGLYTTSKVEFPGQPATEGFQYFHDDGRTDGGFLPGSQSGVDFSFYGTWVAENRTVQQSISANLNGEHYTQEIQYILVDTNTLNIFSTNSLGARVLGTALKSVDSTPSPNPVSPPPQPPASGGAAAPIAGGGSPQAQKPKKGGSKSKPAAGKKPAAKKPAAAKKKPAAKKPAGKKPGGAKKKKR